jgi:hypothetical protein
MSVGLVWSDVLGVIAFPAKTLPGEYGRTNVWGYAANGVRIRVTFDRLTGEVRTVDADSRYE